MAFNHITAGAMGRKRKKGQGLMAVWPLGGTEIGEQGFWRPAFLQKGAESSHPNGGSGGWGSVIGSFGL